MLQRAILALYWKVGKMGEHQVECMDDVVDWGQDTALAPWDVRHPMKID